MEKRTYTLKTRRNIGCITNAEDDKKIIQPHLFMIINKILYFKKSIEKNVNIQYNISDQTKRKEYLRHIKF